MLRISTKSHREQVRVSKQALKKGIDFYRVGCSFIRAYKKNPNVMAVKLLFVTAPQVPYGALTAHAKRASDITRALCGILEGMPTDCSVCHLKPICDEVEDMKTLHFGQAASGSDMGYAAELRSKSN